MKIKLDFLRIAAIFFLAFGTATAQSDSNKLDDKGNKHGLWKGIFEESKRIRYEGTFNHGKETGIFTFYDDTKAHTIVATRDFTKGNNSAYTIFYDQQKKIVSEGNVVNKLYEGQWTYYHKGSKTVMAVENYKKGKLDGKRSVFYPDGKPAEETIYKNGLREGIYKKYAEKGAVLEEAVYKNGEFHGLAVYKAPDGSIVAKGNFKNGKKDGYWEFFENGKLTSREKYPITKKTGKPKSK